MAEPGPDVPRVGWLDGLRGIAAMQVVLLHYASAFLPAMVFSGPTRDPDTWAAMFISTPLGFLVDGSSAVYLFFIMSGVALTYAFSTRPYAFLTGAIRRVVRLGLPMAASIILAVALFSLIPAAHFAAAEISGSEWLHTINPQRMTLAAVVHQVTFEGMLAGYTPWSLLPKPGISALGLVSEGRSFNPPLWTLHIEFYGSVLVLTLVALRASVRPQIYYLVVAVTGVCFALSLLSLFIVGHLAAGLLARTGGRRWQTVLGATSLAAGIILCSVGTPSVIARLHRLLPFPPIGLPGDEQILQKMIGAILVFGGVAMLPVLRRILECPVLRWLGAISFSLYLSHFPLLFTLVALGFTHLAGLMPYGVATAISTITGILASFALAALFERHVDRPAIRLSRRAGLAGRGRVTSVPA